jgi:integrase
MRGHLTRRGQRSWRLKYDLASGGSGRQTRYVTLHGTRAQAEAQAAKVLASVAGGTHVDPSGETVAGFVERWLRDWADDNVSNKTWTRYAQLLRSHLAARVGHVPLQKLRAANLQAIYAAMAQAGLADRTRLHLHRVTHTMLKHAVQWGVVARNVATMVDAPRVQAREVEILTPAQIQAVLDTLRGKSLYPIVATARSAPGCADRNYWRCAGRTSPSTLAISASSARSNRLSGEGSCSRRPRPSTAGAR